MVKKIISAACCAVMAFSISAGIKVNAEANTAEYAGRYSVQIQLLQYNADTPSMGSASMQSTAVLVVDENLNANVEIDMIPLQYVGQTGYMGNIKCITEVTEYNQYYYPINYDYVDGTVIDEYVGLYDTFNDPDSDSCDAVVGGKWYPKKVSIPINIDIDTNGDICGVEDEYGDTSTLVQVYVPVMESIGEGNGTKFARLSLDWSTITKAEDYADLAGTSVSVSGDITLNSYVSLTDKVLSDADAKLVTRVNNTVTETAVSDAVSTDNGYMISTAIPAKCMTSDVAVDVVLGTGAVVSRTEISAAEYAMDIINGSYSEKDKAIAKAMLNYGAYAQEYFGYNTGNLANSQLEVADKSLDAVTESLITSYRYEKSGSISGITYSGSCLVLEGKTRINHYFTLADGADISSYSFTIDGAATEPVKNGDMYYISTNGISAGNLDDDQTIAVSDGSSTMKLTYSALDYCDLALRKSSNAALQSVVKALYLFYSAAK